MPTKPSTEKIVVENVIRPGKTYRVDAHRYGVMRKAFLRAVPTKAPGLTLAELLARIVPLLPDADFPGGAKAGWWFKTVQLDLEAKGVVARTSGSPLRVYKSR
jgi:hypothetical protein